MRRVLAWILSIALLPVAALADTGYADFAMERTLREQFASTSTRMIDVPGRGQMTYYAQCNPFWDRMRYETAGSGTFRRFGDGGCCPTSAAIAIANLLPIEELAAIRPFCSKRTPGFGVSTASMNPRNASSKNGIFWFEHAQDYYDFLPLICGQFAAGNNPSGASWRAKPKNVDGSTGGTSIRFVEEIAEHFGLTCTKISGKDNLEFLDLIRCGATAVCLANTRWQPFSTGIGHYVALVAADDTYVYIMDPQDKADYQESDYFGHVEVLERGLVRVKIENYHSCQFSMMYVLSTPEIDEKIAALQKSPQN